VLLRLLLQLAGVKELLEKVRKDGKKSEVEEMEGIRKEKKHLPRLRLALVPLASNVHS